MRGALAAAVGSLAILAGFAGPARASATIDLIWQDSGTNVIGSENAETVIQLNVILTAGPAGSQGGGVSVDFSQVVGPLVLLGAQNTPSLGNDSPLPVFLGLPILNGLRVEFINSLCLCDTGIGVGLQAGQSHQLGTVTFSRSNVPDGSFEITSDIEGMGDGILDGNGNLITLAPTFNSAFVPEPGGLLTVKSGVTLLALLYRRRRHSAERDSTH